MVLADTENQGCGTPVNVTPGSEGFEQDFVS
jgi:hypothetical protein